MKRFFTLITLFVSTVAMWGQTYDMTIKLNDGRILKFPTTDVAEVTFDISGTNAKNWAMPNLNFGKEAEYVIGSAEPNETTRTAEVTVAAEARNLTYTYFFDADYNYKYAKLVFSSDDERLAYESYLTEEGFTKETASSTTDYIYRNTAKKLVAFIHNTYAEGEATTMGEKYVIIGAEDETIASWTRTTSLKGTAAIYVPFFGKGASKEMMWHFENRSGNTLVANDAANARGVYRFNTTDSRWKMTRYWFDAKTKNFLEEVAIYCDASNRPTPAEVAEYLASQGFAQTGLKDGSSDVIYYNRQLKIAAFVTMSIPENAGSDFMPSIQFSHVNLDAQLPPEKVILPWPVTEYNKLTIAEAIDAYKQKPYFKNYKDLGGGLHQIDTSSPDFPVILLLEEGGKYLAALVGSPNVLTLSSPHLPAIFTENGYEKYTDDKLAFDTYVNWTEDKEIQVCTSDLFDMGIFFIVFEPNERKKN
ncbi:MAG: hypothetical protein SOZ07_07395 [Prevotella sp.]|nr:hypothetical protein [Prevotellaceae bacterium]MDY3936459.1 hypothetical protein [Prevotella sp.]